MRTLTSTFLIAFITSLGFAQAPINDFEYTFKVNGLPDSIDSAVYVANYFGGKQYYYDTLTIDKNGEFKMSGDSINGGIYSIIMWDRKSYFEFVVNEPKIEMETEFNDYINKMQVKASEENTNFYEYLRFVNQKSELANSLKKELQSAQGKEKEKAQETLMGIDKDVIAYKKQFMADHPDLFISKVFRASAEPDVPEYKEIKDEKERNKRRYVEFKAQYLEGVDLTDDRLLRTPVLHNKLNYYVTKLTPQAPDSIIATADMLVGMAGDNKEVRKYIIHTITSKYEDSKIMGMDAVLIHMGEQYYCPDKAWWLSEEKLEKFCERISAMSPLMIGKPAPNLILLDTAGEWKSLYGMQANYTVLYFWDSGCGHCKKVTPKLKEFYDEYKAKGVEVYAVGTEFENDDWKKYIHKNGLNWTNVSDTPEANENAYELIQGGKTTLESLNFRDTYDIFSTPKVFLLDKNKKIIATKLSPEQIGDFIDDQMNADAGPTKDKKNSKKSEK